MDKKYGGWYSNKFLNVLYLSTIAFIFLQYINDATIHNTALAIILFVLFLIMLSFTVFLRVCNNKLQYGKGGILDQKARRLMKRLSIKDKKCTILDLGCKQGFTTIMLAKSYKRASIKGVDINDNEECLSHIKEEKLNKRIEIINSSLTSLPFNDESMDFVYSFFPSKKDSKDIIKEGLRVLKKNGYIAFEGKVEDLTYFKELGLHIIEDNDDVPQYLRIPTLLKDNMIIYGKKI